MKCPKCGAKTKVIDTRPSEQAEVCWRRRRECLGCKHIFTTYEVLPEVLIELKQTKRTLYVIRKALGVEE